MGFRSNALVRPQRAASRTAFGKARSKSEGEEKGAGGLGLTNECGSDAKVKMAVRIGGEDFFLVPAGQLCGVGTA